MKLWRRRRSSPPPAAGWWIDAEAAAEQPSAERLAALRASPRRTATDPDEAERIDEMLEGLERVLALSELAALPILETQHRVIGDDVCHFSAPASLRLDIDSPGRVFATSRRLVFAGGSVQAWPWHRVLRLVRSERVVTALVAGAEPPVLVFNSYGDALMMVRLATRLRG